MPRTGPVLYAQVTEEVHASVRIMAALQHRSISEIVGEAIERWLAAEKPDAVEQLVRSGDGAKTTVRPLKRAGKA